MQVVALKVDRNGKRGIRFIDERQGMNWFVSKVIHGLLCIDGTPGIDG